MLPRILFCAFFLLCYVPQASHAQSAFVEVKGTQFYLDGEPYIIKGTNFWYGFNLASRGEGGDRERLLRELDQLKDLGLNNLRIMAGSEGPNTEPWRMSPAIQPVEGQYDPDLLEGLDFLLAEMAKRELKAVLCLNNFWPWSGGMAQYVSWASGEAIPYPPPAENGDWRKFMQFSSRFYTLSGARSSFLKFVDALLSRTNSFTQVAYIDDPTIMAWELANEPRPEQNGSAYRKWVRKTARHIHNQAPNQLITIGSEGKISGANFQKDHAIKFIDYATQHIWIQNWSWYDPEYPEASLPAAIDSAMAYLELHTRQADVLGKPVVLEEFGIARDYDDHDPSAMTHYRDQYFDHMFSQVDRLNQAGTSLAGWNFWAWGGEGRPREAKGIWKRGDDFIGDPPHEYQGWYSVYDKDKTSLEVIRKYTH